MAIRFLQPILRRLRRYPADLCELEGQVVIVGLSLVGEGANVIDRFQTYGRVVRVSDSEGVVLLKSDATGEFVLPPVLLKAYRRAASGEHRLRATGARIVDPDYTTVWTVEATETVWRSLMSEGFVDGFHASDSG